MPSERSLQRAAQAWCRPTTEKIVMIPELAEVFAEILDSERAEMRQERDDDAWAHAACLTIAETGQKWGPNVTPSLAMQAVHSLYHDREQLKQWVSDCQSGMYINCVYCGHRYGPKGSPESIPAAEDHGEMTMAEALRRHIEVCEKHPMSALRKAVERLENENTKLRERALNAEHDLTHFRIQPHDQEFSA